MSCDPWTQAMLIDQSTFRAIVTAAVLGAVVLLPGCATYPARDVYAARLSEATVLPGRISDQAFRVLESDKWLKYELGGDSRVFDFGSGKSFFAAFEVMPGSMPRRLELRAAFNSIAQARGHVVIPTILVLDADFTPLLEEESEMRQSSAPSGSTEFAHEIDLRTDARYVVVHTDPKSVNREVPWHFSLYIATPVNVGTESNSRAKVGVGGPMRIRVNTKTD